MVRGGWITPCDPAPTLWFLTILRLGGSQPSTTRICSGVKPHPTHRHVDVSSLVSLRFITTIKKNLRLH